MTERRIELDTLLFLEQVDAFVKACKLEKAGLEVTGPRENTREEFQRLVLNGITLATLMGTRYGAVMPGPYSASPPMDEPYVELFLKSLPVGRGTLRRYAMGRSAPAESLRTLVIEQVGNWFRETLAEQRRKKDEAAAVKQKYFEEVAYWEENAGTVYHWMNVDHGDRVALWTPCPRMKWFGGLAMPVGFTCSDRESFHAHIAIECEDGTGVVPARIESREFLRRVCDFGSIKGWLSRQAWAALMSCPQVDGLVESLTDREKAVLDDPEGLEKATTFAFIGF